MRKLILILLLFWPLFGSGQVPFMLVGEKNDTLIQIANIDDIGSYFDVCFDGTYIHAGKSDSLIAYSFDGTSITQAGFTTTGNSWTGLYYNDGRIYGATSLGLRLLTFDGSSYTEHDHAGLTGADFIEVWGNGTYVYAVSNSDNKIVRYFDGRDSLSSDPSSFTSNEGSAAVSSGNELWDVYASDSLVVTTTESWYHVFDTALTFLDEYNTGNVADSIAVAVKDTILFHGLNTEYEIYKWRNSQIVEDTTIVDYVDLIRDIHIVENMSYLAGRSYLSIRNALYPYEKIVTPVSINNGYGIWFDGTYIYLADGKEGLKIYEIQKR